MDNLIAKKVIMVEPTHFSYNEQTAVSNSFQNKHILPKEIIASRAMLEFNNMVCKLKNHGVEVVVLPSPKVVTPDAVFPNNWFSTHVVDGVKHLFIYPMHNPNRQAEVQLELLRETLKQKTGEDYFVTDLRHIGEVGRALEGTGVFVFDHANKIAYLARSNRADVELAQHVIQIIGYELVVFNSEDKEGKAIYHTNVMLAVANQFVIICLDAIPDKEEQALIKRKLSDSGKYIINISLDQLYSMAGNMIQVCNNRGEKYLLMSKQAEDSLTSQQKELIDSFNQRLSFDVSTIESVGGGSVRCMVAEIF